MRIANCSSDPRTALAFFLAALAIREAWCFTIPLDAASDEVIHLYTAHANRLAGHLAVLGVDPGAHAFIHPSYPIHSLPYFTHPPGAYALGALLLAAVGSGGEAYLWLRQLSVLCGALAVPLAFLALRIGFPQPSPVPVAAACFLAFAPQVVFHGSYFSAEGFGLLATAFLYYMAARLWRDGLTPPNVLAAAAGGALLTWSSLTYWPAAFVLLVPLLGRWRAAPLRWRALAVASLALPLWTASLWIGRNVRLHGSWNAAAVVERELKAPAGRLPGFKVTAPHPHMVCGEPYLYEPGLAAFGRATVMSFSGVYGYMSLLMPPLYYLLGGLVCAAALAGLQLALIRLGIDGLRSAPNLLIVAAFVLPFYVALLAYVYINVVSSSAVYQPQGRYLFGGLIGVMLCLALGLREVCRRLGAPYALVPGCLALALGANLWSLWVVAHAPWPRVTWLS